MKALALLSQIFAAVGCTILLMTIVSVVNVDYTPRGLAMGLIIGIGVNIWIWVYAYLIAWFFYFRHRVKGLS